MAGTTGNKRNIAIISQGGVGKTLLAEAMLFNAKATDRIGRVDDGSSNLDFEPEEHKRRITLKASLHHYEWDRRHVTIIDTPGYSGFLQETKNALSAVDGAVLVVSATGGIKAQTQEILKFSNQTAVPSIAFINMMDKERADFESAVVEMEKVLGLRAVRLYIPIGEGPGFKAVVDLLLRKAYIYRDDLSGAYETKDVPAELKDKAAAMREAAVETIVEADDALTEKYLDGKTITDEELAAALRKGTLDMRFVPVVMGSAQKNMGVCQLLDTINMCLPSPLD
ncbi:MAG: GTP-binding protein, partial [Deltaproteobacteria bacterium]|nr:GTP-binding protein [Deltaproteobacteria bacterium]